jgi:hypothetical protein
VSFTLRARYIMRPSSLVHVWVWVWVWMWVFESVWSRYEPERGEQR